MEIQFRIIIILNVIEKIKSNQLCTTLFEIITHYLNNL